MSIFDEVESTLLSEVQEQMQTVVNELVQKRISKLENSKELARIIDRSPQTDEAIWDYIKRCVENEIGNRLRLQIYDGHLVDKVFESVWTKQFEIAIADRIKGKVNKVIDEIIKERLKSL